MFTFHSMKKIRSEVKQQKIASHITTKIYDEKVWYFNI